MEDVRRSEQVIGVRVASSTVGRRRRPVDVRADERRADVAPSYGRRRRSLDVSSLSQLVADQRHRVDEVADGGDHSAPLRIRHAPLLPLLLLLVVVVVMLVRDQLGRVDLS